MSEELGALIRYHRYRAGSFYAIGIGFVVMLLIPTLMLRGGWLERVLCAGFGVLMGSFFLVHALRKRGTEIGVFENAIVFRDRTRTRVIPWSEVRGFFIGQITHRQGVVPTVPPVVAHLEVARGERLLINGGPVGYENVDFLIREIERRIPSTAERK